MDFSKINCLACLFFSMFVISACSSDDSGGGASQTYAAAKYAGSYLSPCYVSDEIKQKSTGDFIYIASTMVLTHVSGSESLTFTEKNEYYGSVDSTCAGSIIGSDNDNSTANTLTVDGQVTIGADTVDKVTVNDAAIGGLSAGGTIELNGIIYPGNYFTRTSVDKNLLFLAGSSLFFGDGGGVLDANGYPTLLEVNPSLTKQ